MSPSASVPESNARVLSPRHCRAICEEIGARLAIALPPATRELPPRLAELVDRLALLDHDAPSIVPSIEDTTSLQETSPVTR